METVVLKVKGMSCGGCVKSVTSVLEGLPGVTTAQVSLEQGEATISFDPAQVGREQMVAVIDDAGFEAA
jgi:copper chaperone